MMLKIWLYGFAVNVRTTRGLKQRVREERRFGSLAGGAAPDHKTLSEFHRRYREAIAEMFTEVLLFLQRAGMAWLGRVAIDARESVGITRWPDPAGLELELRQKVDRNQTARRKLPRF